MLVVYHEIRGNLTFAESLLALEKAEIVDMP
jgi:hypothetical protein